MESSLQSVTGPLSGVNTHLFSSPNYNISILLRVSAGEAERKLTREVSGSLPSILFVPWLYLLVRTVDKEAPEHSFAYFAPNHRNKLLQFDVAGCCRVPLGIFAILGRLPWNSVAICLVCKSCVGLPIHPSLAPWQTSSLSAEKEEGADHLMWKVTFGAKGLGMRLGTA